MKVPSPTRGSTNIPGGQQSYLRPASNPGAGAAFVAQGLGNASRAAQQLEATFKQRDDQTQKFNTLKGFSEFQTRVAERLTEFKRDYRADGQGYADAANKIYGEVEAEWAKTVPQDLREEFQYRSSEVRRGIIGDSLQFQYQQGDAWFKQVISDEISKSKTILDQNPGALSNEQNRIAEFIRNSDLPEAQKEDLARQAQIGLASVTYRAEIRNNPALGAEIGVGSMTENDGAKAILRKEEGFRETPYWDKTAWRIGFGSDTITRPDGTQEAVRPGMRITREDAERDFEYRLNEREGKTARMQLGESWPNLPNNVKAALLSVAYNYGNLPSSVVKAVGTGDMNQVADAVGALGANPARRQREAAIIRGSTGIDADPRFASIPYEDRVALRDDADREYKQQQTQAAAAAKAERDAQQNSLYLGLLDGTGGQVDIDNARASGVLNDYESVNKAQEILRKRDAEGNLALNGLAKIASQGVFDPTSTDDKKMLNAVVKQGNGLARLQAGDQDYVGDIVTLTNQVGDIPTDIAGTLMGMIRSGDSNRMMFALDAAAQLRDTNGIAFNQRFSDDVTSMVNTWDARKDVMPRDELVKQLRGGTTQAERQNQILLRKEAETLLTTNGSGGIPKGKALFDEAVGEFGGYTWSPSVNVPLARQSMEREFQTLFVDEYSKIGDEAIAAKNAGELLKKYWGVTEVGGGKDLMKYPPEKVGYRAISGSYDWINQEARREFALKEDEDFDLFSDEQTRQEFQEFQRNPEANPPSYRAFIKDANGVYRERVDERNQPLRIWFAPPAEALRKEAFEFDSRERRFKAQEVINNYERLRAGSQINPLQPLAIPQEDTDAYNAALGELEEMDKETQRIQDAGSAIGSMIRRP